MQSPCRRLVSALLLGVIWPEKLSGQTPCEPSITCPAQSSPSTMGQWSNLECLKINYNPDGSLPNPNCHPRQACLDACNGDPECEARCQNCWNVQAVHASLTRTGKLLLADLMSGQFDPRPDVVLLDPVTGKCRDVGWPSSNHVLFCSGHCVIDSGLVAFFGGGAETGGRDCPGTPQVTLYDPAGTDTDASGNFGKGSWIQGPRETMAHGPDPALQRVGNQALVPD
ncbi:hypothetical protein RAS1_03210 [Phycisphaerae bacterium RAS1]|nr:hypothetical protein RAS1_03210 [Phycisphaerae bacterium RAS1]